MHDTSNIRNPSHELTKLKPAISIYREATDDYHPSLRRVSWQNMRLFVEIQPVESSFDVDDIFVAESEDGSEEHRILEYVTEMRLAQHRHFSYAAVTCRQHARFLRLDQAGSLISAAFDFKEDPSKLLNFFYLVGQMSDTQLGLDPTVKPAEVEDVKLWDRYAQMIQNEYTRGLIDAARQWNLSKVTVDGEDLPAAKERWDSKRNTPSVPAAAPRQLLVGRPHVGHHTPVGRGTKGYVALDLQDKRFVFLKDSWRLEHDKREPEMVFYALLAESYVANIPKVICGGDVYSPSGSLQRTYTDRHLKTGYCAYIHTRLVIEEIGRPLNEYKDSHELILAVRDALRGARRGSLFGALPLTGSIVRSSPHGLEGR